MHPALLAGLVSGIVSALVTSGVWVGVYFVAVKSDATTTTMAPTTTSIPPLTSSMPSTQLPPSVSSSSSQSSTMSSPSTQPPPPTPSIYEAGTTTPRPPPPTQPPIPPSTPCMSSCEFHYAESIPYNLTYAHGSVKDSTIDHWQRLLAISNKSIDIASYYWSLLPNDVDGADYSAEPGTAIFNNLMAAGKRGVAIRIAQNYQEGGYPDTIMLEKQNLAQVRTLNFDDWLGGGILHTKFWNVDGQHFYVGSANLDWRSLTQVKELGVVVYNCPCLSMDLNKIFEVYWTMGIPNQKLPGSWPNSLATMYNAQLPHFVQLNSEQSAVYLSSSPPPFLPQGRQNDLTAIQLVIQNAKKFVNIAVMDYVPATLYQQENVYWSEIDNALRHAAYDRFITVRLLMSKWPHTSKEFFGFLNSLADINDHTPCQSFVNRTCVNPGAVQVKI
uniref:PLD phosphodiesterase domain-containing protein n=1 Tax=Plectus sambesii TaxID=2011161 RepID=A0A914XVW2_9BILA